jgi:trehalose 6-phosphate phosphatase
MVKVSLDPALAAELARIARVDRLLVASDYDGVLAPIVSDPARAWPLPEGITALAALADLPGTEVAVVSGRARADLAAISGLPGTVTLVGSHGAELDDGLLDLSPELVERHDRLHRRLSALTDGRVGVALEIKPASVVVHTRNASRPVAAEVAAAVRADPATWPGVHVTDGKEVIELAVLGADKGTAVEALRERGGAEAVLFLGDDVTDESVFAVLRDSDVGVKVGPGLTRSRFRVASPPEAVRVLSDIHDHRISAIPADSTDPRG